AKRDAPKIAHPRDIDDERRTIERANRRRHLALDEPIRTARKEHRGFAERVSLGDEAAQLVERAAVRHLVSRKAGDAHRRASSGLSPRRRDAAAMTLSMIRS